MKNLLLILHTGMNTYIGTRISEFVCRMSYVGGKLSFRYTNLQNGFIRLTKRTLVSLLTFNFLLLSSGLIYLFNPWTTKTADAAWFNDNWAYRKTLTFIHNATVSSATKVKFDIDTTSAPDSFQADCGDVRFTSPNGDILPYYYDSAGGACDNASTDFYVLIPSIINGSNYIYMYYGNPSVVDGTETSQFSESTTSPSGGAATPGSEEKNVAPIAFWKFDEGQGTTTEDSTNNNNDATLAASTSTPTWLTEDQCITNKCLLFDGSNDYASAADSASIYTQNMTISVWVKPNTTISSNKALVTQRTQFGVDMSFTLWVRGSNAIPAFSISTNGTNDTAANATTALVANNWYHIVGVYNGTDIRIYVNGKLEGTPASKSGALYNSSARLSIGTGHDGSASEVWPGVIDELKIYNYARSESQVKTDYNSSSNPDGLSSQMGGNSKNQPGSLSNGLVGYWKMDESSWTSNCSTTEVVDASGNGNNGISCPNGDANDPTTGKFGNAGDFDGTNDYVEIADNNVFDASNVTVSAWVKLDSIASNQYLVTHLHHLNGEGYGLDYKQSTGFFEFRVYDGTDNNEIAATGTGVTAATGSWYHLIGTYDGNNLKIYVNGVLRGTNTSATPINYTTSVPIRIGRSSDTTSNYTDGLIDEARIYNRALSGAEVSQLYNWAPGPVAYYKFDEGSGSSAIDSSSNGTSATINNGTYNNGKYGKSLTFNGSSTNVTTTHGSAGNSNFEALTRGYTVSAWINTTSSATKLPIVDLSLAANNDGSDRILMSLGTTAAGNEGKPNCELAVGGSGSTFTSTTAVNDGKWHYLACVRDTSGTQAGKLYSDGVLVATSSSGTGSSINGFNTMLIGKDYQSTPNYFNGQIDDVKLFTYERTQAQIIEDMNAGHPAPGSPVSSAVAHWKLDEGYGTTANDSTPNRNDLTLSTATSAWSNSGKFGKAWDGNASRYLSKSDDADFDVSDTDDYSISLWYKSDNAANPGATEYLFNKANATTAGYAIYANTSGNLCFGIDDDTSWGPDIASCTSTDVYDATWHHLTAVRNVTSDTTAIFIDGQQKDSDPDTTSATLANSLSLYVADRDGTDNGDEFNGDLDEIKVYRSPLTAAQIAIDMNKSQSEVLGTLGDNTNFQKSADAQKYCITGDSSTCTAPVGEWNLDEGTGTTANDSSGNAKTGTITAGTGSWVNGKTMGKAFSFDGADTKIQTSSSYTLPTTITIEAWINPKSAGEGNLGTILSARDVNGGRFGVSSNNVLRYSTTWSTGSLAVLSSTNAININQWQHVAVTYDGSSSSNRPIFYVNGKVVSIGTDTSNNSGSLDTSAFPWIIGNVNVQSFTFDGSIDQVRVFDYVRTPAQIALDYNQGKPIAHWKMDECQGTTINDSSGNSLTGTWSGSGGSNTSAGTCQSGNSAHAWYNGATGKRNYSLDFDNTDDQISLGTPSVLDLSGEKSFSVTSWVKLESDDSGVVISQSDGNGGTNQGWELNYNSGTDFFTFYVDRTGSAGDRAIACNSAGQVTSGNWYFITAIYDGPNDTIKCSINAGPFLSRADATAFFDSTATIYIGRDAHASGNFFNGQIDDVRIFNYPLTTTQVKTLYNEGTFRVGPSTGAP